jgi:rubrerythrin
MVTPGQKPSRIETSALIKEIASQTHLPDETVRLVMDTFISITKEALIQEEKVVLRHFGTFVARRVGSGGFDGVSIRFKPAEELKSAAKEALRPMEKYSVETKSEAALLAQVTGECPDCKSKLETTKPPKCPSCGTKPFESKEPG